MQLKVWMDINGVSVVKAAELSGIDKAIISRTMRHKTSPSMRTILAIRKMTGGKVDLEDHIKS